MTDNFFHLTWIAIFWGKGLYCTLGVWLKATPNWCRLKSRNFRKKTPKEGFVKRKCSRFQIVFKKPCVCMLYFPRTTSILCKLLNFHRSTRDCSLYLPCSRCSGTKKMAESLANLLIRVVFTNPLSSKVVTFVDVHNAAPPWDGYINTIVNS